MNVFGPTPNVCTSMDLGEYRALQLPCYVYKKHDGKREPYKAMMKFEQPDENQNQLLVCEHWRSGWRPMPFQELTPYPKNHTPKERFPM